MTAATLTEIDAMAHVTGICSRVKRSEWPAGTGDSIRDALEGATDAQDTYYDILHGRIHPAAAYPELEHDEEAFARALAMAVEDATDWAAELVRALPATQDTAEEEAAA